MSLRHVVDRWIREGSALWDLCRALTWVAAIPPRHYLDGDRLAVLRRVRRHTMVGYRRLSNVYDVCRESVRDRRPGAFVECGVWKGGAAAVMALLARREGAGRKTWLFDSFEGLPEPTDADGSYARRYAGGRNGGRLKGIGKCAAPLEEVRRFLFDQLGLDPALVPIRKGWFQDTLEPARAEIGPIAILRIDADWFESTSLCLERLYDQVVPGGYVLLDDYGYWEGCRRAIHRFVEDRRIAAVLRRVDHTGAYFRKP